MRYFSRLFGQKERGTENYATQKPVVTKEKNAPLTQRQADRLEAFAKIVKTPDGQHLLLFLREEVAALRNEDRSPEGLTAEQAFGHNCKIEGQLKFAKKLLNEFMTASERLAKGE